LSDHGLLLAIRKAQHFPQGDRDVGDVLLDVGLLTLGLGRLASPAARSCIDRDALRTPLPLTSFGARRKDVRALLAARATHNNQEITVKIAFVDKMKELEICRD